MSTIRQTGLKRIKNLKKLHTNNLRVLDKCPQKRGIVVKKRIVSPKKPNSAKRKVVRIRIVSMGRMVTAKLKGQESNLQAYSKVLVCGGRANDLPGVRYNMIKGVYDFGWQERFGRRKSRSKYGIRQEDIAYAISQEIEKAEQLERVRKAGEEADEDND